MSDATTVLVTGASGFVGSAVACALESAGMRVRALVRRTSRREHLAALGVEMVEGDLRDSTAIAAALVGVRYVFHVAADYRLWARRKAEIFESNVTGTRILMEEAMRAGVERVVYTSSVATLALAADGAADERTALAERDAIGAYKRSKVAAEQLVLTMARNDGLPVVVVNPSTPIGPRDWRPTPTGRIIVAAACVGIPGFVDTGLNLVHVDDVARGHIAALRHGRIGERYILGGENVQFSQMLADIAEMTGRRAPRLRVPWLATVSVACVAEAAAWVTGREPLATLDGARMARHRMFFTAAKAERELGIHPRPYRQGLEDAVRWFHDSGYLR